MIPYQPNQMHPALMSISSLLPYDGSVSASRKQMAGNALSQTLVINDPTERFIQTGVENEFGKYTFNVKVPEDCVIIRVIDRYPRTVNASSIQENPQTVVIYEEVATKKIGCMSLTKFFSQHQHFGFKYRVQNFAGFDASWDVLRSKLQPRTPLEKGTVLLDSPAINRNGGYMFGRECNVAFMTHPAVAEDGILMSKEILESFKYTTTEIRTVEFGSRRWPLNLYGDEENYQAYPEIGQYVREDGQLMCLRSYDDNLSPVEMSRKGTSADSIDHITDHRIYVPAGRGRVVDIRILHDPSSVMPSTPPEMIKQSTKYDEATKRFYQQILEEYRRLEARPEKIQITNEFHQLVQEALGVVGLGKPIIRLNRPINDSLIKQYRKAPLDDWRIQFVIEYENTPKEGNKFTDLWGGKGVCCKTLPRSEMPRDADGNIADIVMHSSATFNRMNFGRFYEQYVNAAHRDFLKNMTSAFGLTIGQSCLNEVTLLNQSKPELVQHWYGRLLRLYEIINPKMPEPFLNGKIDAVKHLAHIIQHKIHLDSPPDNDRQYREMVNMLKEEFPPLRGPVTYVGNSGKTITTRYPVLIGSMYIVELEKTGDDWTAVSSGKWQIFGALAHLSKQDKHSTPIRYQPIRAFGEAEIRIIISYMGAMTAAELLDRNGNVTSHTEIARSIISAPVPSNILSVIDRDKYPLGMHRALQLIKHLALCGGWNFVYRPHTEHPTESDTVLSGYL